MSAPPPPPATNMHPMLFGGALLIAGFAAGFFAGRESLRHDAGGATRTGPHAGMSMTVEPATMSARGDSLPPAAMPKRTGHTFTGEIDAPPHGAEGHDRAARLLAGVTCPCGGCQHMQILECGCDVAREVEGLAAHLLERGKAQEEVLAQLEQHFGLVVASRGASHAPSAHGLPDALEGLADAFAREPSVTGPADVPTGARKTAPGP